MEDASMEMLDDGYSTGTTETYYEVTTYVPVSGREYLKMSQNQRREYERKLFEQLNLFNDPKNALDKVIEQLDITQNLINQIEWSGVDYPAKDHDDIEILHERLAFKRLDLEDELYDINKMKKINKDHIDDDEWFRRIAKSEQERIDTAKPFYDKRVKEINMLIDYAEEHKMYESVFDASRIQKQHVEEVLAIYKKILTPSDRDKEMLTQALDHMAVHIATLINNFKEKQSDDLEVYRNFLGMKFNLKGLFG